MFSPGDKVVCTKTINDGFFDLVHPGTTGYVNTKSLPEGYIILWGEKIPYGICLAYEDEINVVS